MRNGVKRKAISKTNDIRFKHEDVKYTYLAGNQYILRNRQVMAIGMGIFLTIDYHE